ncbi:hypothetical protein [Chryseobacterium sp. JK1]|uniref:hypothetical protein n=1 Tax=Chryseobacterium sp. JK1 TaxID=874294 RepID=UPI003D68DA68
MEKIKLTLPISNTYSLGALKIMQKEIPLEMELIEGNHIINSDSIEIGNYFQYKIFAYLSIPYSYDPDLQYVTIAGPDDTSDRQIRIITNLETIPETTYVHLLNSKGLVVSSNNLWSDFIEKSPEIRQVNKIALRQTIETLVQQLLDAGVQGVIQTGTPPVVTPDNYNDYKAMFMPEKEDVQQPTLEDILQVQAVVFSTYYGTITWTSMYSFANIMYSTNDPKPPGYSSWITLWNDKCNGGYYPAKCTSYNYSNGKSGFVCGTDFVGGHVIPGTTAKSVAKGGTAYIFPICKAHNNNDNIYMSCRFNPKGVVLKNYNQ